MSEEYKKIILIAVIALAVGAVVFFVTRSFYGPGGDKDAFRIAPPPQSAVEPASKERLLQQAVAEDPDNPEKRALLGDYYFEITLYDKAIEEYRRVLELAPGDVDTYNDLGLALYYTRQGDAALETLRKGAEIAPTYQRIWLSLGFVLWQSGRGDEAREALTRARDLGPETEMGKEAEAFLKRMG
ncbi:MAG: hypothetical protein Kow0025_11390 [Thermodesulfovibrionales bacterium]